MKKILSSVVAAGLIASVAFGEKVKLYTHDFYKNPNYEGTHQCYKFIDEKILDFEFLFGIISKRT